MNRRLMTVLLSALTVSGYAQDSKIRAEHIQCAEQVIGLEFTETERDSMLEGLNDLRETYQRFRKFDLDNRIVPALIFNPLPTNFQLPQGPPFFQLSDYSTTQLPENPEALAFYTVGELSELIRTRQISSLELTRFCLDRLRQFDPILHCVTTLTDSLAIAQAERADRELARGIYRGPLHGVPYGVKDLFSVKGYKTTWGAMPFKDQEIDHDAAVVRKLEEAGAVLAAKLSMGALAWGDVWFGGQTRNPWDPEQGSSGSSAGSASAVAAGLLPFAIGTETWGSIVSPSTVCGVTGLRPTFGRVSRAGAMALSWSMDKIGSICRTVEDCAIVFQAIHGPDENDPSTIGAPFHYTPEVDYQSLRIGYLEKDFASDYPFHETDSLTIQKLREMGAILVPIELPDIPVSDISFILEAEAAAAFDELTRSNRDSLLVRQIRNAWPNVFRQSRFIPAVEYINANRVRSVLIHAMDLIMQQVDLYAAPSWQGDNLLLTNLTGHPCVVLPNGFHDGTPTSITFTGRLFDEGTLLAAAKAVQDATGFHRKHPEIPLNP